MLIKEISLKTNDSFIRDNKKEFTMTKFREHVIEENKYSDLLKNNPQYRLNGYDMKRKKVVVGIIQGNPEDYKSYKDHLDFKYFDSWKDAYIQLEQ